MQWLTDEDAQTHKAGDYTWPGYQHEAAGAETQQYLFEARTTGTGEFPGTVTLGEQKAAELSLALFYSWSRTTHPF